MTAYNTIYTLSLHGERFSRSLMTQMLHFIRVYIVCKAKKDFQTNSTLQVLKDFSCPVKSHLERKIVNTLLYMNLTLVLALKNRLVEPSYCSNSSTRHKDSCCNLYIIRKNGSFISHLDVKFYFYRFNPSPASHVDVCRLLLLLLICI